MKYIWTEDTKAGFHYWQLLNQHLFQDECIVESKGSNQGLLDAVRALVPEQGDLYFLAFDLVYDNMDIVNKYLELQMAVKKYPEQIKILDLICFEHIILDFSRLVAWTGTKKTDKIVMREDILASIRDHRIDLERISRPKTREYLMGFKTFSTERVLKAIANELTENDMWQIKGKLMGACWYQDCCVSEHTHKTKCKVDERMSGDEKMREFFGDRATQNIIQMMQ